MKNLIILFISLIFISCNSQNCETIPLKFDNYKSALEIVQTSTFQTNESCYTSKSSWIKNAHYYSCDKEKGFFILSTKKKDYIYQNVPYNVWNNFKNATSHGKYFNEKIKERYKLQLKQ